MTIGFIKYLLKITQKNFWSDLGIKTINLWSGRDELKVTCVSERTWQFFQTIPSREFGHGHVLLITYRFEQTR